jgi:hypothetical protein
VPKAVVVMAAPKPAFQKPQMRASARRTIQTDGRDENPSAPANATASAILTPISLNSSHNAGYSEAYYQSTAPIGQRVIISSYVLRASIPTKFANVASALHLIKKNQRPSQSAQK